MVESDKTVYNLKDDIPCREGRLAANNLSKGEIGICRSCGAEFRRRKEGGLELKKPGDKEAKIDWCGVGRLDKNPGDRLIRSLDIQVYPKIGCGCGDD